MSRGISVVIPSRSYEPFLRNCLVSVMAQEFSDFEVIVVFNPDQKMNVHAWGLGSRLRAVTCPKGVNRARNKGLSLSRHDLILFLDADCILKDPQFLKKYFDILQMRPDLTGAGGPYRLPAHAQPLSRAYHFIQSDWIQRSLLGPDHQTQHLLGGNMIFRRSKLKKFRFEESLVFGGTETELCSRLRAAGHQLLMVPELWVEHCSELTIQDLKFKAQMQGLGRRWVIEKKGLSTFQKRGLGLPSPPAELSPWISLYHREFQKAFESKNLLKQAHTQIKKICHELLRSFEISYLRILLKYGYSICLSPIEKMFHKSFLNRSSGIRTWDPLQ